MEPERELVRPGRLGRNQSRPFFFVSASLVVSVLFQYSVAISCISVKVIIDSGKVENQGLRSERLLMNLGNHTATRGKQNQSFMARDLFPISGVIQRCVTYMTED